MQNEILPHSNPNYLHGCHAIGLSDFFREKSVPLIVQPAKTTEPINPRLILLKGILNNILKRKQLFRLLAILPIRVIGIVFAHRKVCRP